jgi:hypothetical protein
MWSRWYNNSSAPAPNETIAAIQGCHSTLAPLQQRPCSFESWPNGLIEFRADFVRQKLSPVMKVSLRNESLERGCCIPKFDDEHAFEHCLGNSSLLQVLHRRATWATLHLLEDIAGFLKSVARPTIKRTRRTGAKVMTTVASEVALSHLTPIMRMMPG